VGVASADEDRQRTTCNWSSTCDLTTGRPAPRPAALGRFCSRARAHGRRPRLRVHRPHARRGRLRRAQSLPRRPHPESGDRGRGRRL